MDVSIVLPTFPALLTAPNAPFIHRDLSWLQFNERVLAEAELDTNPILERAKFLAIFSTNMDEFFMVRYPSLIRSIQSANRTNHQAGLRLLKIQTNILDRILLLTRKQNAILKDIVSELSPFDVEWAGLSPNDAHALELGEAIFDQEILPKLLPPDPFLPIKLTGLENLQLGAIFGTKQWFKIPRSLPLVFIKRSELNQKLYCFFLDSLLSWFLGEAYGFKDRPTLVRLTRDGDFTINLEQEDSASVPDLVRSGLGLREKGRPVRLQYLGEVADSVLSQWMKALRLTPGQILEAPSTLCLQGIATIKNHFSDAALARLNLLYEPLRSLLPPTIQPNLFDRLDRKDILLHHPYDAFDGFIEWIAAACQDCYVTQIEQTVYRMDALSPVIELLKKAAPHKTVRVVIELRARFDELNNLRLAEELKKAGVQVSFGFGKLKLHAKVALVTRVKDGQTRRYTHLSTGNYSAITAKQYTDLAILTSHPEIGSDVRNFFDRVCCGEIATEFKRLVPAPAKLHRRLIRHIQAETEAAEKGKKARIVAKVNALVDDGVIQQLYRASQSGVQIDLIVRGACSLVPGIKGLSENIRVISVVDRFLEHSRIYYFSSAQMIYLSSADWMPRNFFSRLELAFPILDPCIYEYIEKVIIPIYLSDTVKARELSPEGAWRKRKAADVQQYAALTSSLHPKGTPIRSQFLFEEIAIRQYRGTPLEGDADEH